MDAIQIVTQDAFFPIRKRAFKPKTTTGCMTCRIRRIKCDEAHPSCSQCLRGRRTCDGYLRPVTIKPKSEPKYLLPKPEYQDNRLHITPSHISHLFKSPTEAQHFSNFMLKTAPSLSGPFKSEFWSRLVLQATHHELAIRHAIIAISALHTAFEQCRQPGRNLMWQDDEFALQHYLKAIKCLVMPVGVQRDSQLVDVALITCVLFVCFEVLRGYHGAALSHIEGGIRLFKQVRSTGSKISSRQYAPLQAFHHIFARLDNQASSITHNRRRKLLSTPASPSEAVLASPISVCFPTRPFESMEEARIALDQIQNAVVRATSSGIDPNLLVDYVNVTNSQFNMELASGYLKARLDQWSIVFDSFVLSRQSHFAVDDWKALRVLQILRAMMAINFSLDFRAVAENELLWDDHFPAFKDIVENAREFEKLGRAEGDVPTLTLEMEIIFPLYFAAAKCRDGRLRREAIDLLESRERQEGIWNSSLTMMLANRLMRMEEKEVAGWKEGDTTENGRIYDGYPLMEDIKCNLRVKSVQVAWDVEKRRVRLCYHGVNVEDGGEGVINESKEMTLTMFPYSGLTHFQSGGKFLLFWVPNYQMYKVKVERKEGVAFSR